MKLSGAIKKVMAALRAEGADDPVLRDRPNCDCLACAAEGLVAAIEEHLEAERKSAETLLCLYEIQKHGGE